MPFDINQIKTIEQIKKAIEAEKNQLIQKKDRYVSSRYNKLLDKEIALEIKCMQLRLNRLNPIIFKPEIVFFQSVCEKSNLTLQFEALKSIPIALPAQLPSPISDTEHEDKKIDWNVENLDSEDELDDQDDLTLDDINKKLQEERKALLDACAKKVSDKYKKYLEQYSDKCRSDFLAVLAKNALSSDVIPPSATDKFIHNIDKPTDNEQHHQDCQIDCFSKLVADPVSPVTVSCESPLPLIAKNSYGLFMNNLVDSDRHTKIYDEEEYCAGPMDL